jgi:hypothetical protein
MYCITDGDHIYTLNKDLESLAPEDGRQLVQVGGRLGLQDARQA